MKYAIGLLCSIITLFSFSHPAISQTVNTTPAAASSAFVSKEGRFRIVMPKAFVPFKQSTFSSVSSWGDPMTVVQFFSYPADTAASRVSDPPFYAMAMYFDYSTSMTSMGFNSELLELVHKATLRRFPEFLITKTERAYWKPSTGARTMTERIDESVFANGPDKPVITSYAHTADGMQLVRADSYLAGRRVYWTITVYSPAGGFDKTAADAFSNSFRLLP
jgi:hypothetical protein